MTALRTSPHSVLPDAVSPARSASKSNDRDQDRPGPRGEELVDLYLAITIVVPILMFLKSLWT